MVRQLDSIRIDFVAQQYVLIGLKAFWVAREALRRAWSARQTEKESEPTALAAGLEVGRSIAHGLTNAVELSTWTLHVNETGLHDRPPLRDPRLAPSAH